MIANMFWLLIECAEQYQIHLIGSKFHSCSQIVARSTAKFNSNGRNGQTRYWMWWACVVPQFLPQIQEAEHLRQQSHRSWTGTWPCTRRTSSWRNDHWTRAWGHHTYITLACNACYTTIETHNPTTAPLILKGSSWTWSRRSFREQWNGCGVNGLSIVLLGLLGFNVCSWMAKV